VHVTNTLRLLKLPRPVLALLEDGSLSAGHGRALLGSDEPEALAKVAVAKGLSVREVERLAQQPGAARTKSAASKSVRNADIAALEKELADRLGLKVTLLHEESGKGELRIAYRSLEQFDVVLNKLRR